jgi:hypothetical protein
MSTITNIYRGGQMAGKRTYIVSGIGILSCIASYLVGDSNIMETMNNIFPLAAIYFLRKGLKDGK